MESIARMGIRHIAVRLLGHITTSATGQALVGSVTLAIPPW